MKIIGPGVQRALLLTIIHTTGKQKHTLQNGDTQSAIYNKYGAEVMVVHGWSDRWQVEVSLSDDSSVTVHQSVS